MELVYGIDLSKEKFDVYYLNNQQQPVHKVYKNNFKGIVRFLDTLKTDVLLCAEHTGIYGDLLVFLANAKNIRISLIPGYNIKYSLGLQKGKSDKIDSARIREYGLRFRDKLKLTYSPSECLHELREIFNLRSQLVQQRKMLSTHLKNKKQASYSSVYVNNVSTNMINGFDKNIDQLEQQILQIIHNNKELEDNFRLVTSVKSVGKITACELIIKTGNFNKINTAKKAASYAGVCPFPNESGKMVAKCRTNKMSDKSLKSLLFLCALNAIKFNKEYKLYYERKKLEGKPTFLIMNNVANKLLRTIYSVLESKQMYDPNYVCLDPREKLKKSA